MMMASQQSAFEISEDILVRTGIGLKCGDFDVFATCFALPHHIETFEGSCVIHTLDDMHEKFRAIRMQFHLAGVTELVRRCVDACFYGPNTIEMVHRSHQMCGTHILHSPYPVYSIVRRQEGAWKITHGKYAMADTPEQSQVLAGQFDKALM